MFLEIRRILAAHPEKRKKNDKKKRERER